MIKKKPVSVKGLVFDMDGLLLDSEKVVKRSWDYAGKELGYENFGDHIYNTVGFNLKRRTEYFKTNVDLDFPMDRFAQMTREYYYRNSGEKRRSGIAECRKKSWMYDRTCNVFAADTRRAVFEKSGIVRLF